MEDDLFFFQNGRRPNFSKVEDDLNFFKMEDDLNFFQNGRGPHFSKIEDEQKNSKNGRRPYFFLQNGRRNNSFSIWKTSSIFFKI